MVRYTHQRVEFRAGRIEKVLKNEPASRAVGDLCELPLMFLVHPTYGFYVYIYIHMYVCLNIDIYVYIHILMCIFAYCKGMNE